ncbi:MAG: DNA cytosine methyltransferase [Rhodospirillales bacterium]|nr:DNA cytosine methyltransferase [Rhodospirillales bacterium]
MGRSQLSAIDLFCGAGGLSLGLRMAGYRVRAAVERDAVAARTYRMNHRKTVLLEADIRKLSAAALLRAASIERGDLDLLAACPPCQGFSTIRTRNAPSAVRDVRNSLIGEVLRFVRNLRPRAVLVENVPGLAKTRQFVDFCAGLRRHGYAYRWSIVNAQDHGVPQRRRRLVLVAARAGEPPLPVQGHGVVTVRDAIGHLSAPRTSTDALHNYVTAVSEAVLERIRRIPRDGGSRSSLPAKLVLDCHRNTSGFRDVYGRMSWSNPAPTLTGGCINPSKGRFVHPKQNRAITLREAALLQGFPAKYQFDLSGGRYRVALQIGNAVPPPLAASHAVALTTLIARSPSRRKPSETRKLKNR